jgi:hypothetical protein
LTGLHNTREEIRRTRPCVSALRSSIESWFGVISQLHAGSVGETWDKMYTCKTYDHFCCVHLIPMIAREGNVVKYATFSTEHDNSLIRQDLRAHTSAGGGPYGEVGVSDVKQLFDRRTMMRCDAVLCAAFHRTKKGR